MKLYQIKDLVDKGEYEALTSTGIFKMESPFSTCYLRKNGNYYILFFDDGTKVRFGSGNSLDPDMPECIDCTITTLCNGGCEYCYLNCHPTEGQHAFIIKDSNIYSLMEQLPPYTELAMNINDFRIDTGDMFYEFLKFLKERKQFVNLTVNQKHLTNENMQRLVMYKDEELIRGIGISFNKIDNDLLRKVKMLNKAYGQCCVIHVIAGILSEEEYEWLSGNDLNILILGYKEIGKGIDYADTHADEINDKIAMLSLKVMDDYRMKNNSFKSIAFDGLSIEQLNVQSWVGPETYKSLYAGDEGAYTFYLDLARMQYSISSISDEMYDAKDKSIKQMFDSIKVPGLRN